MKHSLVPVVIVIVIVIAFVIVIVIYLDLVWIEALTTSIDSTSSLWSQKEKTSAHVFVGDLNEIFLKLILFLRYLHLESRFILMPSWIIVLQLNFNLVKVVPITLMAHGVPCPPMEIKKQWQWNVVFLNVNEYVKFLHVYAGERNLRPLFTKAS